MPSLRKLLRHPVFLFWLCVFAWWAGRWFWVWWPAPQATASAAVSAPVADAGRLMSARVFGKDGRTEAHAGKLRLIGVNTDARMGFALVEIDGKARSFVRGESLPDGRRIADIAADRLLLEQGGKRDFLPLDRGPGR